MHQSIRQLEETAFQFVGAGFASATAGLAMPQVDYASNDSKVAYRRA
jgi:hypothetical protein